MTLISRNKAAITVALMASLIGLSALFAAPVQAQSIREDIANKTCDFTKEETCDQDIDTEDTLSDAANTIINLLSIVVAAAAVIFIIIGGVKYVTSNGNQEKVTQAKNTILYAIIGLVIVIFAQTILNFVVGGVNDAIEGNDTAGISGI